VLQPRVQALVAPLLADRRGAPIALDRIGKQIGVGDRALVAKRLRQIEQRALIAEMRLETQVHQPHPFQIEMFSKHDRPREQAEKRETGNDDLVDRVAAGENIEDVGGGEKKRGREQREHDDEKLASLSGPFNGKSRDGRNGLPGSG